MSLVVICEGSLSLVDTCTDALAKVAMDNPEQAEMLMKFKMDAPDMVRKCAEKAIKRIEVQGIRPQDYVVDETNCMYYCRSATRPQNFWGSLDANYCMCSDAFKHGMGIKIDGNGRVTFNTVRHQGKYDETQQAEMDRMRKAFSAALITEFYQAALAKICTTVTTEIIEQNGRRIVHLQGVKS